MRAAVILISFLSGVTVFSYVSLTDIAKRNQAREPATETRNTTADPEIPTETSSGQPVVTASVMTIDGQPFDWEIQSLTLSEQLQQQAHWLASAKGIAAIDEELVTEISLYDHDTPYPSRHNEALDTRGLLLLEQADNEVSIVRRWEPGSGAMSAVLLLQGVNIRQCLAGEYEIFCLVRETSSTGPATDHLVFVSAYGGRATVPLTAVRDDPHLELLPDRSVLIVGGISAGSRQRVNAVERVTRGSTHLEVERLPDMPGPLRWGYATVVLLDGRFMVVGGNTSAYKGCAAPECSDRTYILDPAAGQWTEGPVLLEPRASATASLLTDGSVIVAGGWTLDRVGNAIRSRSTERLRPGASQFVSDASLPIAMAEQRPFLLSESASAPVLLMDEGGKSLVAYDLDHNEWRVVGGFSSFTNFKLGPFSDGRKHFFWASDSREEEWSRQAIRIRGYEPRTLPPEMKSVHLYRAGSGFLPGEKGMPALMVGGHVSNPFRLTSAVDSFSEEEGLQALSPVRSGRYDAQVFRLRDGAIAVAGGVGETSSTENPTAKAPPIEVLRQATSSEKWQSHDPGHPQGTQYAQAGDSVLVALWPGTTVERLTIDFSATDAQGVRSEPLPRLPAHRESGNQEEERVVARGLKDGRLVVAGGYTYDKRIAVYTESPDVVDEYVGIGSLVPANTYEVFDPASGQWTTSRPSAKRGGQVVVLEDGRVVKLHVEPTGLDDDGKPRFSFLFEVGHADAGAWSPLTMRRSPYIEAGNTQLLAIGNELFVAGFSERSIGMERKRILQWFDGDRQEWTTVWEEPESSLYSRHQDVLARVEITNGRELLVPVGGT